MSLSSPTRLMDVRSGSKPSNDFTSFLLRCYDSRSCGGVCLRTVVLLGSIGSVIYTISVLTYSAHNVHDLIIVCLSIYLAALLPAFFMLMYKICVNAQRRVILKDPRARGHEDPSRCSLKTLRFIFMVMTLLASLAAVLGYIVAPLASVFFVAWDGAAILFAGRGACCGNSEALASKDLALGEFQSAQRCTRSLDACHGFAEAFPPPAPYVSYLKVLEYELDWPIGVWKGKVHKGRSVMFIDFSYCMNGWRDPQDCAGWCGAHQPFFNLQAATGHEEACALRLGRHLWTVSTVAGAPTMAGGALLAALGFLFYNFEAL
eukprot:g11827.t1